tara:strand:+ start:236 stop:412 length:177 start_codon:yes stop_codon:yes gene_type:complete
MASLLFITWSECPSCKKIISYNPNHVASITMNGERCQSCHDADEPFEEEEFFKGENEQ